MGHRHVGHRHGFGGRRHEFIRRNRTILDQAILGRTVQRSVNIILDIGDRVEIKSSLGGLVQLGKILLEIRDIGFLHRIHELALEFGSHAPHFADELAHLAQHARQFLRPNENQRDNANHNELARVKKVEHPGRSDMSPARAKA